MQPRRPWRSTLTSWLQAPHRGLTVLVHRIANVSMGGKKNKSKKQQQQPQAGAPSDEDALLDAAIRESTEARARMAAEAAMAAKESAASAHTQERSGYGHRTLSHQEVVDLLDTVPCFHLAAHSNSSAMIPTTDNAASAEDGAGEPCGCWYLDPADGRARLAATQSANPQLQLALETTPLGTAFALSEGWSAAPADTPLRLQASRAVLASIPGPPDPLPESLRERFNQRTSLIPVFMIEGFEVAARKGDGFHHRGGVGSGSQRKTSPIFFDAAHLLAAWLRETNLPKERMPEITMIDLRLLVARMLAEENKWASIAFWAAEGPLGYAAQLHKRDVARGEEPPPLQ